MGLCVHYYDQNFAFEVKLPQLNLVNLVYGNRSSMDNQITIEPAHPKDAAVILEIHGAAVRQTAAHYYSEDIINNWARPITCARIKQIKQSWILNPDHQVVVAKHNDQIIGFGFIHKNNELQGLYVHPNYGRRGVGAKIFTALVEEAIALDLSYLTVNASLNAEAFYRKQGFEVIKYDTHRLNSGQEMACVKMQKTLR